ncbi:NUDIX hydrolase [Aquibacillus kalidii]|uniref:NUDIX hydrolase n=1 Tax=Aquibacillus kalidii TaxID=2762597 RepID=UPI001645A58C|nr:CoA pyrophosphatase [Aquibacillus kalidii]
MNLSDIVRKVKDHKPTILGSDSFAEFAVLIPLVEQDGDKHILFEVRSEKLRRQPGDICFPGGKRDPSDKTEKDTAIRETVEELGLDKQSITDVYALDYMVSPFGMMVYPFVGIITNPQQIKPNVTEVGDVFTVPLTYFLNNNPAIYQVNVDIQPEKDFPYDLIVGGENYNWRTRKMDEYFYVINDERVIWGLTARIIAHFIDVIREQG